MLQNLLRVFIAMTGATMLTVGAFVFIDPARVADQFGLMAQSQAGLGTIRGDFAGFFLLSGGFALYGALRKAPEFFLVPLILLGCALAGRAITALVSGLDAQSVRFMALEALSVVVLLLARAAFKRAHPH